MKYVKSIMIDVAWGLTWPLWHLAIIQIPVWSHNSLHGMRIAISIAIGKVKAHSKMVSSVVKAIAFVYVVVTILYTAFASMGALCVACGWDS